MIALYYKGRIHRGKFTARSVRYILADQAARLFPALQRRWLLPIESQAIADGAADDIVIPTVQIREPLPPELIKLGIRYRHPLQLDDHFYELEEVVVTGWAGAMIKDGRLLTVRPQHNWVASLRAHPHRIRYLPASRVYYNLTAATPARGHIFHWLYDFMLPLLSLLESRPSMNLGLIVNARPSAFQCHSLAYLRSRYGITEVEHIGPREAVQVPRLRVNIPIPHVPRALVSAIGLATLDDLCSFIAGSAEQEGNKRLYISRNDARLRRVLNEEQLLPLLEAHGFERTVLGGMPLDQQIKLFRDAEMVIAPHGAGLAHISWCRPGTKIVEFFPNPDGVRGIVGNASADYWLISRQRALSYSCYFAGPIETSADGFSIPENVLIEALERSGMR